MNYFVTKRRSAIPNLNSDCRSLQFLLDGKGFRALSEGGVRMSLFGRWRSGPPLKKFKNGTFPCCFGHGLTFQQLAGSKPVMSAVTEHIEQECPLYDVLAVDQHVER